jgi:hypothetical protein
VAAAGVLGAAVLAALAIWLVPKLDPNPSAAGAAGGSAPSAQPSSPARGHPTPSGDPTPAPTPSGLGRLPAWERAEARVVVGYFTAINDRDLAVAWALGGDHLYPSQGALIAAYANISHVAAKVLGVQGHTVLARIRATSSSGSALPVLTDTFTVENGAIASGPSL